MAIPKEYLGAIVLEVDGREVEIESYTTSDKTGRKLVKTMNRTGRPSGFTQGVGEYNLTITAPVPTDPTEEVDWASITSAKLTHYPSTTTGQRVSYLGCFTQEVSEKYEVDNEAKRDITMSAIKKVTE
ncbi:phage tail protein [Ralstonia pseudosolanacearum]|uniref:phage tail protein n=1 Tax=Ralstonia pseudosolanacearum TaxID=1310165 RepID=UPI0008DA49B3|nr:phage tail protein [Ralstonia pseudosolanacearum]MCL1618334.1 phage tail protein [Ralstonia pseudosolanacearum CaRs-Mep]